ncbi:virulence protein, partial [Campylobacter coli]|nr:virulence protein [Campylobacter coli]
MQKNIKRNLTMDFLSFSLENQEDFLEVIHKDD